MSDQPKIRLKFWGKALLIVVLVGGLSVGGFAWHLAAHHNFHVISAGKIYRSCQMDAASWAHVIQEQKIKSILNLRGNGGDQAWYNDETNTAYRMDVKHYDFALSASHEVDDAQIDQILATIDRAPKPMLIHCKNGCDRTGLISAVYLYSREGKPAEIADHELTVFYGHVPYLFWRDTIAMDRSFWRYVKNHPPQSGGARTSKLHGPVAEENGAALLIHDSPADSH